MKLINYGMNLPLQINVNNKVNRLKIVVFKISKKIKISKTLKISLKIKISKTLKRLQSSMNILN